MSTYIKSVLFIDVRANKAACGSIYIYIYIGGLGELVRFIRPQNREIDFDFDLYFDLFVRGEAKLRERVRGASLSLGLPVGSCAPRRVRL